MKGIGKNMITKLFGKIYGAITGTKKEDVLKMYRILNKISSPPLTVLDKINQDQTIRDNVEILTGETCSKEDIKYVNGTK